MEVREEKSFFFGVVISRYIFIILIAFFFFFSNIFITAWGQNAADEVWGFVESKV